MILVTMTTDTDYSEWFINEKNEREAREFLNYLESIRKEA